MASIQDIGDLVESFVSGELSAAEFANSFRSLFQSALKSQDPFSKSYALAVHAQISHHFNGLTSEQDLRANLEPFRSVLLNVTITCVSYYMPSRPLKLNEAFAVNELGQMVELIQR
jgi:hypothetical protein